jgi:hypothetical protein
MATALTVGKAFNVKKKNHFVAKQTGGTFTNLTSIAVSDALNSTLRFTATNRYDKTGGTNERLPFHVVCDNPHSWRSGMDVGNLSISLTNPNASTSVKILYVSDDESAFRSPKKATKTKNKPK